MDPFDVAQSFLERSAQATSRQALGSAFQTALEHLGFRYFACCSHVDPGNAPDGAVLIYNYPDRWVREYLERKLYRIDPVLKYAEQTSLLRIPPDAGP